MSAPKHHKPENEAIARANGPSPHSTTEEQAPMVAVQYRNGPDLSAERAVSGSRRQTVTNWLKKNFGNLATVASIAVACGALTFLPVTRGQLDATKNEINGTIKLVQQKVDAHDDSIKDIKFMVGQVNAKVDAILLKLTPDIVPASDPPPAQAKIPIVARRKASNRKHGSGFPLFGRW